MIHPSCLDGSLEDDYVPRAEFKQSQTTRIWSQQGNEGKQSYSSFEFAIAKDSNTLSLKVN